MMCTLSLFFFHNPKAAGTSLNEWLRRKFVETDICPLIETNTYEHSTIQSYTPYAGYKFYSGHYGRDIYTSVAQAHTPITSFRHPVSRILSLYNYFRFSVQLDPAAQAKNPAVMAAKAQDIESFVNSGAPEVRIYTHNHHFRQLTQSGWELNNHHDTSSAIELIDTMPWHYICEEPELSKSWASSIDWLGPLPEIRQNQTAPNPDAVPLSRLPQRVIESILGNNEADLAIYDYALGRARRAVGASTS